MHDLEKARSTFVSPDMLFAIDMNKEGQIDCDAPGPPVERAMEDLITGVAAFTRDQINRTAVAKCDYNYLNPAILPASKKKRV